ncbi:glutamine synthetase beta-grasp domain-containing protein, partial [Campylobacter upsaliensis]
MGKFVNNIEEFFTYCKENEVAFVDFRFTDIIGTWHHITYNFHSINEETFELGIPFDGSSLKGWQPVNKSDMILKPDAPSAFLDPFTADQTIIVFCDVYDIYKGQMYEKCPRSIAKKALQFLQESGVADMAYFGPENEFFIFDSVKIVDNANCSKYEVDTEEGEWNDNKEFVDSYNTGHRPRNKGGYFPVAPIDSLVDIRAEMVQTLEKVGIKTFVHHHEVAQGQAEIGVHFGTLVEAADNVQIYKYIVKMVAHL